MANKEHPGFKIRRWIARVESSDADRTQARTQMNEVYRNLHNMNNLLGVFR